MAHHGCGQIRRQITCVTRPRVIGVTMGDQRAIDGSPRVNVKIACGAIDAFVGECQNRIARHAPIIAPLRGSARVGDIRLRFTAFEQIQHLTQHHRARLGPFHQDLMLGVVDHLV